MLDLSSISMLPAPVLERLSEVAGEGRGGILEIGSYVGGSTIALARGSAGRRPHAVIECGGSHSHPTVPSSDILADLKQNLSRFGVADAVRICEGYSYDNNVLASAISHVGKVSLLFMDADGNIAPALRAIAPYLSPDCRFVFDDYISEGAGEKAERVRPFIDLHVSQGHFVDTEVVHGTWFGRLGPKAIEAFKDMAVFIPEQGHAFVTPARFDGDTVLHPRRSALRIFEDDVELGPAHSAHDDIRNLGAGRFSHWSEGPTSWVYMSASDNSDPRYNGRRYTFMKNGELVPL